MESINKLIAVPSWAYDFCYYYSAVAAVVVVYTLYSVFLIVFQTDLIRKNTGTAFVAITALVLSGLVTTVLTMMQFWICRSALKPAVERFTAPVKKSEMELGMLSDSDLASFKVEGFTSGAAPNKK